MNRKMHAAFTPPRCSAPLGRRRLAGRPMDENRSSPLTMTPVQMATLVDAALGNLCPLSFLDSAAVTFRMLGRVKDATTATWIGCLLVEGEIEVLLNLRAAWRQGHAPNPADAARHVTD